MAVVEADAYWNPDWLHLLGASLLGARVLHAYAFLSVSASGVDSMCLQGLATQYQATGGTLQQCQLPGATLPTPLCCSNSCCTHKQ